jgi:hypothetical protein
MSQAGYPHALEYGQAPPQSLFNEVVGQVGAQAGALQKLISLMANVEEEDDRWNQTTRFYTHAKVVKGEVRSQLSKVQCLHICRSDSLKALRNLACSLKPNYCSVDKV